MLNIQPNFGQHKVPLNKTSAMIKITPNFDN